MCLSFRGILIVKLSLFNTSISTPSERYNSPSKTCREITKGFQVKEKDKKARDINRDVVDDRK